MKIDIRLTLIMRCGSPTLPLSLSLSLALSVWVWHGQLVVNAARALSSSANKLLNPKEPTNCPLSLFPPSRLPFPQVDWAGSSSSQNASTFTLCCPRLPSLRLPLSARLASRTIAAYFNLQLDFLTFLPDVPCALKACLLPRLCLGICDHWIILHEMR